jgi:hypothetical protein
VRVILVTDTGRTTKTSTTGYDIALITTAIEVTFFDVKNILGVGEARNRVPKAVQRTVPFGLFCHSVPIAWYVLHGHHQDDPAQRRASAPWFTTKAEPSTLDMLVKLRRQLIATRFMPTSRPRNSWKSSKPGHKEPRNRES